MQCPNCQNDYLNLVHIGGVSTNGRQLNASHSEDSVTETTLSKKNSDGKLGVLGISFAEAKYYFHF